MSGIQLVLAECQAQAHEVMGHGKPVNRGAALVNILISLLTAVLVLILAAKFVSNLVPELNLH